MKPSDYAKYGKFRYELKDWSSYSEVEGDNIIRYGDLQPCSVE